MENCGCRVHNLFKKSSQISLWHFRTSLPTVEWGHICHDQIIIRTHTWNSHWGYITRKVALFSKVTSAIWKNMMGKCTSSFFQDTKHHSQDIWIVESTARPLWWLKNTLFSFSFPLTSLGWLKNINAARNSSSFWSDAIVCSYFKLALLTTTGEIKGQTWFIALDCILLNITISGKRFKSYNLTLFMRKADYKWDETAWEGPVTLGITGSAY